MKSKYLKINAIRCKTCWTVLISLHVHDFRQCVCGNFVDGGFDYVRRGGKPADMEELPLYWKKESK